MKADAIVWVAPNTIEFDTVELPEMGPRDVLIETAYSLVSPGTEREWLSSDAAHVVLGTTFPFVPGYSVAGSVRAVGDEVTEWAVGDRVVGSPTVGAHAAHVLVQADSVFRVPDNVSLDDAVYFNLGMTAAHTLSLAGTALGSSVAIIGQGPIGFIATQIAKACGAWPIAVLEIDDERRRLAIEAGATYVANPMDVDDFTSLQQQLGHGSEITIDLSASSSGSGLKTAINVTAPLGTVILSMGLNGSLEIPYGEVFIKGLTLKGGFVNARILQSHNDTRQFLRLLSERAVKPPRSESFSPKQAVEVYKRILDGDRDMQTPMFVWGKDIE